MKGLRKIRSRYQCETSLHSPQKTMNLITITTGPVTSHFHLIKNELGFWAELPFICVLLDPKRIKSPYPDMPPVYQGPLDSSFEAATF